MLATIGKPSLWSGSRRPIKLLLLKLGSEAPELKAYRGNRAASARCSFEIRLEGIYAQQGVGGIVLRAKAIIRHDIVGSGCRAVEHGREALHWLLVDEWGRYAVIRCDELSRCRSLGKSIS